MAAPEISASLQKRMKLSLATQGGDLGQELILLVERALEISTISLDNATFTQETIQLNEGGATATLAGAGMEMFGDADAIIAYMRVATDITNLELKAPTGSVLTLNIDANAALQMSQDLVISGASPVTINQPLLTTSSPIFANLTITSFAANWTNAGRTVADLGIITTADINGGTIDGTSIGATTAAAAIFSTLSIEADSLILDSDDAGGFTTTLTQSATAARVLTLPDTTGTLATLADVQASDSWEESLAISNISGANDVIVTIGQKITTDTIEQTVAGGSQIDMTTANVIKISTDDGTEGESGIQADPTFVTIFTDGFNGFIDITDSATLDSNYILNSAVAGQIILQVSNIVTGDQILVANNEILDKTANAATDVNGVAVGARNAVLKAGVTNSVALGGIGSVVKTDNTSYMQQIGFTETAAIEGLLQKATLTASSKTWTLPNLTGTVALTTNDLSVFAATTSAELAGVISDETGTGLLVFGTNPTLTGVTTTAVADIGGVFLTSGTTTSSGAAAVAITGTIHEITTTGTGNALTLANGTEGQIIQAVYVAEAAGGDTAILTPTSLGGADSTITFNDLGDSITLLFTAGAWYVRGSKDVVIA